MRSIRLPGAALSMGLVLACSTLPTTTRTGAVRDVLIGDQLNPTEVMVSVGDEVRWINKRNGPVRIVFLDGVSNRVSCNNGFGGVTHKSGAASLDPNETASICLENAGYYRYTIRMESGSMRGELNAPGAIRVGDMGGR
jgi:plastocyanin